MGQHRDLRQRRQGRPVLAAVIALEAVADQGPLPEGHRPGAGTRERGACVPGPLHGAPDAAVPQRGGRVPGVPAHEVEEGAALRLRRDLLAVGVGAGQDVQLLELEPEAGEPARGVRHRLLGATPSRGGGHHVGRPTARLGRGDQQPVLLLVAGLELVSTDQRQ